MKTETKILGSAKETIEVNQRLAPFYNFDISIYWNTNYNEDDDEINSLDIDFVYLMPGNKEVSTSCTYSSDMFDKGMTCIENAICEENQGHRLVRLELHNRSSKKVYVQIDLKDIESPEQRKLKYSWIETYRYALMFMAQENRLFEAANMLIELNDHQLARVLLGDNSKVIEFARRMGRKEITLLFEEELIKKGILFNNNAA